MVLLDVLTVVTLPRFLLPLGPGATTRIELVVAGELSVSSMPTARKAPVVMAASSFLLFPSMSSAKTTKRCVQLGQVIFAPLPLILSALSRYRSLQLGQVMTTGENPSAGTVQNGCGLLI